MAVQNSGAALFGLTNLGATALDRMAGVSILSGSGSLVPGMIQKFVLGAGAQRLSGAGAVSTWRLSHFAEGEFDPLDPRSDIMQLRPARLSTAGFFGDD